MLLMFHATSPGLSSFHWNFQCTLTKSHLECLSLLSTFCFKVISEATDAHSALTRSWSLDRRVNTLEGKSQPKDKHSGLSLFLKQQFCGMFYWVLSIPSEIDTRWHTVMTSIIRLPLMAFLLPYFTTLSPSYHLLK